MAEQVRNRRRSSSNQANRVAGLMYVLLRSSPCDENGAERLGVRLEPVLCPGAIWFREVMRAGVNRRPGLTTKKSESGPHAKRVAETRAWLRHTSVRLADAHADHRTLVERFRDEIRNGDRMEGMDPFAVAALRVIWSVMALPPEELTPPPKWYSCGVFLGLLEIVVPVPNGLDSVKVGLEFCYCRLVGLLASDDWRAALERYTRSRMPDGWEDYDREQRAADEVSETITNIIEGSLIPPWPLHDARAFLFGVLGRRAMHVARDSARHIGWDAVSHSMEDRNAFDEYERVWRVQHVRSVLAPMTDIQRTVLIRYFGHGDTAREIADDRGRAEATIREIIRRGKRKFLRAEM